MYDIVQSGNQNFLIAFGEGVLFILEINNSNESKLLEYRMPIALLIAANVDKVHSTGFHEFGTFSYSINEYLQERVSIIFRGSLKDFILY